MTELNAPEIVLYSFGALFTFFLCLYVIYSYIRYPSKRKAPAGLMVSKTVSDFFAALIYYLMLLLTNDATQYPDNKAKGKCTVWGILFFIFWSVGQGYFSGICWDLFRTLGNPFRRPSSGKLKIHLCIWIFFIPSIIITASFGGFAYRDSLNICFTCDTGKTISPWNFLAFYIPLGQSNFCGVVTLLHAIRKLNKGLAKTFELRWMVIRRQLFLVACFTIQAIITWLLWYFGVWLDTKRDDSDPISNETNLCLEEKSDVEFGPFAKFVIMVVVLLNAAADGLAWTSLKCTNNKRYSRNSGDTNDRLLENDEDAEPRNFVEKQNLSNALRAEVIAYMTEGLAKSVRNTAQETCQIQQNAMENADNIMGSMSSDFNSIHTDKKTNWNEILETKEPVPPKSTFPQNISQSPANHKGCINQFSVFIKPPKNTSKKNGKIIDVNFLSKLASHSKSKNIELMNTYNDTNYYNNNILVKDEFHDDDDHIKPLTIKSTTKKDGDTQISLNSNGKHSYLSTDLTNINDNDPYYNAYDNCTEGGVPFTDYAPHAFRYLRQQIYKISDKEYLKSVKPVTRSSDLKNIVNEKFSEGRSGAFFFFTHDSKYIIKTITKTEGSLLIRILPQFVDYFQQNPHSLINRFMGMHSVKMYDLTIYFVVLENVFVAKHDPHEKYDLKGSWIDRHTNYHVESGKLMKDEDLHKTLRIDSKVADKIYKQLKRDSNFLKDCGIMDYSVLLGIYYVGIDPKDVRKNEGIKEALYDPSRKKSSFNNIGYRAPNINKNNINNNKNNNRNNINNNNNNNNNDSNVASSTSGTDDSDVNDDDTLGSSLNNTVNVNKNNHTLQTQNESMDNALQVLGKHHLKSTVGSSKLKKSSDISMSQLNLEHQNTFPKSGNINKLNEQFMPLQDEQKEQLTIYNETIVNTHTFNSNGDPEHNSYIGGTQSPSAQTTDRSSVSQFQYARGMSETANDNDSIYSPSFRGFPRDLQTIRSLPDDVRNWQQTKPAPSYSVGVKNFSQSSKAVKAKVIEGPGIYYLGIIDVLQEWNTKKKLERLAKVYLRCKNKNGISCVEPDFYRKRFLRKMFRIGIAPMHNH